MNQFKYFFIFLIFFGFSGLIQASVADGTIDISNSSALLCENDVCSVTSTINFLPAKGVIVHITDNNITGKIWSEKMGWINLNPHTSGVTNTSNGVLGGYAWGENTGWVNFSPKNGGVSINSNGEFEGYAWAENVGWIKFDCNLLNACVKTDWRPISVRTTESQKSPGYFASNPAKNDNTKILNTIEEKKAIKNDIDNPIIKKLNTNKTIIEKSIKEKKQGLYVFDHNTEIKSGKKEDAISRKDFKNFFSVVNKYTYKTIDTITNHLLFALGKVNNFMNFFQKSVVDKIITLFR